MPDTHESPARGQGRIAFLACLSSIKPLIQAGHTQKSIYDRFKDKLLIGYPQFTRYVDRYIVDE